MKNAENLEQLFSHFFKALTMTLYELFFEIPFLLFQLAVFDLKIAILRLKISYPLLQRRILVRDQRKALLDEACAETRATVHLTHWA